ncbi:MAG: virginiamycin B lyase family protein [Miltoncostaeaceae bacterium]
MSRIGAFVLAAAAVAVAAPAAFGAVGDMTAVTPAVTGADQTIRGIATGPSGNVWFTMPASGQIVRMNPQTQAVTQFDMSGARCEPQGIALGPDGAMWFGCQDGAIGRITTAGDTTYYAVGTPDQGTTFARVDTVITGPDGNIWFAQFSVGIVGIVSPASGFQKRMQVQPAPAGGLTVGGDGNVWATYLNDFLMYRITPGGRVSEVPVGAQVASIATAPSGDVWGVPFGGIAEIQVVPPAGAARSLPLGGFSSTIARGPLGFMWVGDNTAGRITRVAADGALTTYTAGISWNPRFRGVAAGADGNMWFAGDPDPSGNATLFRVATGAVPTVLAAPSISGAATTGATLTADPGAWTYQPSSYAYRWERCTTATSGCTVITGATAQKYKVTAADAARYLRVGVVATNLSGPSVLAYSKTIADADTVVPGGGAAAGGGTPRGTSSPGAYVGPVAIGENTLLWTRGSATAITTGYRVGGAGHFAQSATARGVKICSTSRTVAAAGTYTATCRLNAVARAMQRSRPLHVTVTSTYTQDGLPTAIAQVRLTLPRSGRAAPVTG